MRKASLPEHLHLAEQMYRQSFLREDGVEVVDGKVDLTKYQMDDQMEE